MNSETEENAPQSAPFTLRRQQIIIVIGACFAFGMMANYVDVRGAGAIEAIGKLIVNGLLGVIGGAFLIGLLVACIWKPQQKTEEQ